MKIRKNSIAWYATRKPLQIIAGSLLAALLINNIALAETPKITPETEEIQQIEQVVEVEEYKREIKEMNPCKVYDVPLDADTKLYIETMCRCYEVPVEIIYGIMAVESNFDTAAVGDHGNSIGLMQIQPRWNRQRMSELNVTDLHDATQNAHCGIDIVAELMKKYDAIEDVLICFNYGETGAMKHCFNKGIHSNSYTEAVLAYAENL